MHPGRSGRNHLRWLAATNDIAPSRIDEVLALVGLTEVARRKVKGYSLGMRQRLGLAGVLLGDPHTVILDEPANGLDPEGIRWIRDVLVHLARGRAHRARQQPPAVGDRADGRRPRRHRSRAGLIEQGPVQRLRRALLDALGARPDAGSRRSSPSTSAGPVARSSRSHPDGMDVHGLPIERIGQLAAEVGAVLHELSPQTESLEDAFLRATAGEQEYRSGQALPQPAVGS